MAKGKNKAKTDEDSGAGVVTRETIFPESVIKPLVRRWQECIKHPDDPKMEAEAMDILVQVINKSTEMFSRFAQHERFHLAVPLDILVSTAQTKLPSWLSKWDPSKGSLFSWLSICAKNSFRSDRVKEFAWAKKHYATDDTVTLDMLSGVTDHAVNIHDEAAEMSKKVQEMVCPWDFPRIKGALQFILACITDDDHNKTATIRGATFAWGLRLDMAKFLYNWSIIQLRSLLYNKVRVPFTDVDIIRHAQSFTPLPAMIDEFGWPMVKRMILIYGGTRVRVPTIQEIVETIAKHRMVEEVEDSDKLPESYREIIKRHGRTEKTAEAVFNEVVESMDPRRSGEYPIFE